jgi:probable HAF family extracellular repeat protein
MLRKSRLLWIALATLLAGGLVWAGLVWAKPPKPPPPPPPPPPLPTFEYCVTWLPYPFEVHPRGMNDQGDVVGTGYIDLVAGEVHAVVCPANGVYVDLNDEISPAARTQWLLEDAFDINSSGVIVGRGTYQGQRRAFRFDPAYTDDDGYVVVENLGTLPGGDSSQAWAINDRGDVAGRATAPGPTATGMYWAGFYLPAGGSMINIGELTEGRGVSVHDMNEFGVISGDAPEGSGGNWVYRVFRYSTETGIENLGGLDQNENAYGAGINDWGQVAGSAGLKGHGTKDMFLSHAFLYTDGIGMVDLGTLGGKSSDANDINNSGYVVGDSQTEPGSGASSSFLYHQKYGMVDLLDLIPESQLPLLSGGVGRTIKINDFLDVDDDGLVEGQILGYGPHMVVDPDGTERAEWGACILTPVPVPVSP